jgi:hypothetical protein
VAAVPTLPVTEDIVRLRVFFADVKPMDASVIGMEGAP